MLVVNTHFDHRGATARERSAALLGDWIGARGADPVVLLGDLNAAEDSAPLRQLRRAGLRDSFRVLHPDAERVGPSTASAAPAARVRPRSTTC